MNQPSPSFDPFGAKDAGRPLVSIVLPSYNGSRFIAESIDSCLSQTYTRIELIVVDDASTDRTRDICASYASADERVRVVTHERNKKLPSALNTGFSRALGEFFTWTSDDNVYEPNAISRMVEVLSGDSEVGLVYCDYGLIDESGAASGFQRVKDPERLRFGCVVGPCFLYRRAVAEKTRPYDESMVLAEDYDFWLRAFLKFRIAPLHENLYRYRVHPGQLSAERTRMIAQQAVRARAKSMAAFDKAPSDLRGRALLKLAKAAIEFSEWRIVARAMIAAFLRVT